MAFQLPSFFPGGFFEFRLAILPFEEARWKKDKKSYLFPQLASLYEEESFTDVYGAYSPEGLYFHVEVFAPIAQTFYPEVSRGDSFELFIDTRNVKTSAFNTKFCHHFFFLPHEASSMQKGEITRFRGEHSHPLCDPSDLHLDIHSSKDRYRLEIFISKRALVGYDPVQFKELGISYRVNRYHGEPQHFSGHSTEFKLEQMPSLWAHAKLTV